MRDVTALRKELAEVNAELDDLHTMSEEAACFRYNVSSKESAIELVRDWIEWLIGEIEKAEEAQEAQEAQDDAIEYHFAFPREKDFWNYKY